MSEAIPSRKKYVRAVGPRLRVLLFFIFGLVALLGANSAYLASITFLEWLKKGVSYQNYFYQYMFLAHLVLGLLLVVPFIVFGVCHIKNAYNRPNQRAVRVGYALFVVSLILLISGIVLMRLDFSGLANQALRSLLDSLALKAPQSRSVAYWTHVVTPLL